MSNKYLTINREAVSLVLQPAQQAAIIQLFEPLFDELIDRMSLKVRQLCDEARPRYYSRAELAELLHVSLPTVHGYIKDGRLTPLKINGKTLFNASEVDRLIEGGELRKYARK